MPDTPLPRDHAAAAEILVDDGADWSAVLADAVALADRAAQAALAAGPARDGILDGDGGERLLSLSIVLADDAQVRALNRAYRDLDKPTNVLSFALRADGREEPLPPPGVPVELGDILLARETVEREAAQAGHPLAAHLSHLVVHGVLHLLGYDHQDDAEAEAMEAIERRIVMQLGYDDPYRT